MPKLFKKTLILTIILAIFLAPVSSGIKMDTVGAQADTEKQLSGGEKVMISVPDKGIGYASAIFDLKITNTKGDNSSYSLDTSIIDITDPSTKDTKIVSEENYEFISFTDVHEQDIEICFGLSKTEKQTKCDSTILKENTDYKLKKNYYNAKSDLDLGCTSLTSISLSACIAQVTYIVWSVSALIARLAAHILDFFIYYATNSSSYKNDFVEQAWGAVRDVANIFFIIALLYVALKTILGLNVTDNKKLISAVILVALIINFSLFTTKVVIDASNILAKVFYNNITSKDANAQNADGTLKDSEAGVGGQKSISIGIVDKFNPQGLVTQENYTDNPYTFIFMVILLIAVTLYTAYIFFSVALLFVARVVSLWISMIFSPIAFASYTVPFEIPGFVHKEWWKGLLENAFLAPLFIFFLYIIILFTGFLGKIISYTDSPDLDTMANLMQRIMSVTIPFVIIVMLLTKAKKLAVKLSGDMGAMINKIGAVAGGLALGAATGGTALAARTVIGGGGGYFAGQAAKGAEKMGLKRTAGVLKDVGKFAQKSSFDLRGVKVAGQSLGSITGMKLGETQKGGWTEMKKRQVEKKQKRAEELKQRETSEEKKEVDNAEIKLKDETIKIIDPKILRPEFSELGGLTAKAAMEAIDKKMDKARIDLNDTKNAGDLTGVADAKRDLDNAKKQKDEIRDQNSISSGGTGSIKDFEGDIRKAKDKLLIKEEKTLINYTSKISSEWNKIPNQIFRLGAYSRAGADEAVRKIRTGTKLDSGEKPH